MNPKQIQQIEKLAHQADSAWESQYRELIAAFNLADLRLAMRSYARLHERETILSTELSVDLFVAILEKIFITLWDREAVNPVAPLTKLGERDLERMRRATGIGISTLEPPTPTLTDEQKREIQVREDWKKLSTDQIKKKMNDRLYKATFDRIVDTLGSQATLHTVIGS